MLIVSFQKNLSEIKLNVTSLIKNYKNLILIFVSQDFLNTAFNVN